MAGLRREKTTPVQLKPDTETVSEDSSDDGYSEDEEEIPDAVSPKDTIPPDFLQKLAAVIRKKSSRFLPRWKKPFPGASKRKRCILYSTVLFLKTLFVRILVK